MALGFRALRIIWFLANSFTLARWSGVFFRWSDTAIFVVQFPLLDFIQDLGYDYFGFKTLEKSYLLKVNGILAYWCLSEFSTLG